MIAAPVERRKIFCKKKTLVHNILKPSNTCPVFHKVMPSSQLDPCRSSVKEVSNKLKSFVIGDDSDLDGLLKKGEIGQATQLAITVLQSANEETECGQTLSQDTKTLVGLHTVIQTKVVLRSIIYKLIFSKLEAESCGFVFVCLFA